MRAVEASFYDSITRIAQKQPSSTALLCSGAPPMTYGLLARLLDETASALAHLGIQSSDRVALVAANGPAMASSFLSLAACCGCAPLNPGYREDEFRFYLEDLEPSMLVVEQGMGQAAVAAAESLGIRVCRLHPEPDRGAGWFSLDGIKSDAPGSFSRAEDVALYLHTSGTTSRPKLVPLTQRNLLCSAGNVAETLALTAEDRCLNIMPLFHIHGLVAAVLASLSRGAAVVCSPGFQATRFFDWLDEFQPTWYTAVPTMHQAIVERAAMHSDQAARARLRLIRSSSASLPPQVMSRLEEVFRAPVVEAYGMTEAAHQMACNPLPPRARKPGSVGPAAGPDIAIMDETGTLLPQGERGEVVIQGPNVTPGYAANPDANQRAFTNGWFRTGDEGYLDADGYLHLTGRLKEMINRGGEKIAPREIDEALMDHAAVAQALAFGVPDSKLGEEVAAAVVLRPGANASAADLQDFLVRLLSDFKIPRLIIFLDEIPKGPTGKLQRVGLAARLGITAIEAPAPDTPTAASATLIERLSSIWKEVLRREDIQGSSHFFDNGGDSILAAQAVARINAATGRSLNVMHLFRTPTPSAFAAWIEANPAAAATARQASVVHADPTRLSPAQERMLFLHEYEEERSLYNRPAWLRLRGAVNAPALQAALDDIVARHEAFRTAFDRTQNGWSACIVDSASCLIEHHDLQNATGAEREAESIGRDFLARPFELAQAPMLRVALIKLAEDEFRLAVSMHHSISDGWSSRIFFRDLSIAYAARLSGTPPAFEPLQANYADAVASLENTLAGDEGTRLRSYWSERLRGVPPLLDLPTDNPRPARETFAGAIESMTLPAALADALRGVAREQQATLFMTLLAGFQCLLARISGITDIVVGTPVAGRTQPEFEPLIGLFVNTLALRCDLSGNPSFTSVLSRTRDAAVEALAHQDLPFERLVDFLQIQRSLSYPPLIQVMFQLRNVPIESAGLPGCTLEDLGFDSGLTPVDISLEVAEKPDGLDCRLCYRTDLFYPSTARTLLAAYRSLLESCASNPALSLGQLNVVDPAVSFEGWRGEDCPINEPLPCAILASIRENGAKTAFVCAGQSLSYDAYYKLACRTASALRRAGIAQGSRVALLSERSVELPAYLLGIWLAGCAIVPIDPSAPPQRVAFLLEDCAAAALLADASHLISIPAGPTMMIRLEKIHSESPTTESVVFDGDNPACIIYTSGSTGKPKGVEIRHSALRNVLDWLARELQLGSEEVFVNVASVSFDQSFADFYLAPALGATVHIASADEVRDSQLLAALVDGFGATYLNVTPSTFSALIESGWQGSPRLVAISGGEALTAQLVAGILPRVRALWNVYGPTETTDISVGGPVKSTAGPVSLGSPVANTTLHIHDAWGQPVLPGFPGELFIGGAGVAAGYINRAELTAERFISLPTPSGQIAAYRTGDLVRSLPRGGFEFLGRVDNQIKIRGYRIEIGEIEAALRACPGISSAAVVLQSQSNAGPRLVGFYTSALPLQSDVVRDILRGDLPEYMVPALIQRLNSLPKTPSGKIDRKTLETLISEGHPEAHARDSLTPFEEEVAGIFRDILGRSDVGPDSDFFDLGGHSLLAVRLVNSLNARFAESPLTLRRFFAGPTVRSAAAALDVRRITVQ